MYLSAATGMRQEDCVAVLLPRGDPLHFEASKTGKEAEWDMCLSSVLPGLLAHRRALAEDHLMLLSTPKEKPVDLGTLRRRWDKARAAAAEKAVDAATADAIRALYLRDARKRVAQKSSSLEAAAELLPHSDKRMTERQ